jgi:hypothetical protein
MSQGHNRNYLGDRKVFRNPFKMSRNQNLTSQFIYLEDFIKDYEKGPSTSDRGSTVDILSERQWYTKEMTATGLTGLTMRVIQF